MNQQEISSDIVNLCGQVVESLKQQKKTVGFAESCTGGLLSATLASLPGVSSVYNGSVISYSRALKENLLHVPSSTIDAHGQVSQPVAQCMANGGVNALNVDWCVSVTGIAGPGGGSLDKPVGTVCFAIAGPKIEESVRQQFTSDRTEPCMIRLDIQRQAVKFALQWILLKLNS